MQPALPDFELDICQIAIIYSWGLLGCYELITRGYNITLTIFKIGWFISIIPLHQKPKYHLGVSNPRNPQLGAQESMRTRSRILGCISEILKVMNPWLVNRNKTKVWAICSVLEVIENQASQVPTRVATIKTVLNWDRSKAAEAVWITKSNRFLLKIEGKFSHTYKNITISWMKSWNCWQICKLKI